MKFYYFNSTLNKVLQKKAIEQCTNLIESGMDAHLYLVMTQEFENLNPKFIKIIILSKLDLSPWRNIPSRLKRQYELHKIFMNIINFASSSDIVYIRYPYHLFYLIWPFSMRNRMCKIISEHNTIEHKEFSLVGESFIFLIDRLMGNLIRRKADGIIGVTNEITTYEVRRSGILDKPHTTIGNGISVSSVKLRIPPSLSGSLSLIFSANVGPWHGIDRLIKGLANYGGATKVILHIAGDGKELEKLDRLSNECQMGKNIIFHGFLEGAALNELFDMCHIAIGSLGIHRKGLNMTSELKIREYTARGIPFICSAVDQDFPDDFPYFKKIPGDESPIDIEEIIGFAKEVYLDPKHPIKMRSYAQEKLDWSVKMKKLKAFCETLVE